jgi:hypothetical protein
MTMSWDEYYMTNAMGVRKRANCTGRRVGAVIVKENRIISTGYNGTPEGITNCLDGGCVRCKNKDQFAPSVGYDVCLCVHAEGGIPWTGPMAKRGVPARRRIQRMARQFSCWLQECSIDTAMPRSSQCL